MKMHESKGPSTGRLPAPKYSTLSEREAEDADLMERLEAHARDPEPDDDPTAGDETFHTPGVYDGEAD